MLQVSFFYNYALESQTHILEPKHCAQIFTDSGDPDRYHNGWATLFDGARLGYGSSLNHDPKYVTNDNLSDINVFGGKYHALDYPAFENYD